MNRSAMAALLGATLLFLGTACPTSRAASAQPVPAVQTSAPVGRQIVLYQAPVRDGVIDPFRPPAHVGAPGNRGLEYASPFGRHVLAAADGVVTFSGQVAGRGVITLQHADGLRTTYTGLGDIWVSDGEIVDQGWSMGAAAEPLHFGARINDHYLDPQILIDASEPAARPRLVPDPSRSSG